MTQDTTQELKTSRSPWEDRWSEPQLDELVDPLTDQQRKALQNLILHVENLDHVQRGLTWYGPAWKWTIEYQLLDGKGQKKHVLCYMVPSGQGPIVCVPLTDDLLEKLPMRRLNKFIRNGIRSAKCAVATHWALWNLSAGTEVAHLHDLIKRKHKILGPSPSGSGASKSSAES